MLRVHRSSVSWSTVSDYISGKTGKVETLTWRFQVFQRGIDFAESSRLDQ
jgi:hypothetical protein